MVDPKLLRSFLAVCELKSFSQAARLRELSQPTVTQHIQRLEAIAGTELLTRGRRGVVVTGAGESLRALALREEAAHREILAFLGSERKLGRIRFGAAEDFASTQLPSMLRSFARMHPDVQLSLSVQDHLSLIDALKSEEIDLALVKLVEGNALPAFRSTAVAVDHLAWVTDRSAEVQPGGQVPIVAYRAPSMTRERIIGVLTEAGRDWRLACECQGLSGMIAAIRAGLGVGVLPRSLIPSDLSVCETAVGLPDPGTVKFALLYRPGLRGDDANAVHALASIIERSVLRRTQ